MKTVKDTILSFPGLADFPAEFLDTILDGRAIDGAAESKGYDAKLLNLAIADTLVFAVNMPDFKESKLSITYPRQYFISTARSLYAFNGEPEKSNQLASRVKVPRGRATNIW